MSWRPGIGAAVGVGSAAAWLLLAPLAWPARALLVFLLVPLPALLLAQTRLADRIPEEAGREEIYLSSAASVWVLAALAMLAARASGFERVELRLVHPGTGVLLGAAVATTLAGVLLLVLGRLLRPRESRLVDYLIPRDSGEKIAFTGLSVSAGVAEELVFRSFLIAALVRAGAGTPLAVAISIVAFAVAHAYQGLAGVVRVAVLGALLTVPYLVTGSVYPSMIAHAALDILIGLVMADWLLRRKRDVPP